MINIPLPEDSLFERLTDLNAGFRAIVEARFGILNEEPRAISAAVVAMETSMSHPANAHARSWARTSDVVAKAIGLEAAPDLMDTKLEMERLGVNLVGTTFTPTPEVTAQEEPAVQSAGVFDLDEIRARINAINGMSIEEMKAEIPIHAEAA